MGSIWNDIKNSVNFDIKNGDKESLIIAMAGIMVRMSKADDKFQKTEFIELKNILVKCFGYKEHVIESFVYQANHSFKETGNTEHFVEVINKRLNIDARIKFAKMVWYVVLSDGEIDQREACFFDGLLPQLHIPVSEIENIKKEASGEFSKYEDPISQMLKIEI